jgi:hypothetical protein
VLIEIRRSIVERNSPLRGIATGMLTSNPRKALRR